MNTNNFKNKFINAWENGKIQKITRISTDVAWNVFLFFFSLALIAAVFLFSIGVGYTASLLKDEPIRSYKEMEKDIYNYEETSKLYFADNKYIGDVQADLQRDEVKLEDVSETLIQAVLATEDELFYEHNGVVPKAIVRAVFQEVFNTSMQTGGSTLTQQLIKNQMLTNEVSFDRKAKEIVLALRLENHFEKDQILEAYLNVIPYGRSASGRNIAGIRTASEGVFNVKPSELSLAQAAFLAGLPQNPYAFTPFTNKGELKEKEGLEAGINRMKVVLKRMRDVNYISQAEYDQAKEYDITKDFTTNKTSPREKYPTLVFEIEKQAKEILMKENAIKDGYTLDELNNDDALKEQYAILAERALRMNGYTIKTTIHKELYETMNQVAKDYPYYGPNRTFTVTDPSSGKTKTVTEPVQAGGVLIENTTGKVISFVGNRQGTVENHFNFAMNAKRQTGSTIKPLIAYAPAMELGAIQPGSVVADIPKSSWPKNYGGNYYGLISAREALIRSHNVSTVEIYKKILSQNPADKFLTKMGIEVTPEEQEAASLALGVIDMSVEENTSAFTTFANKGKHIDPYMIERIESPDGDLIYEHKSEQTEVFSPQTAYLTLDMMRDVVSQGTGAYINSQLHARNVDWAGKTGTTNDYKDAWFVGTNPNVTLGTWIGYETPASIWCDSCSLSYSQRNLKLWTNLVNKATEVAPELMAPSKRFEQPKGIVHKSYCATSGLLPSKLCSDAGLVRSDIYNSKHIPTKVDDSLIGKSSSSRLVLVNGKEVIAGEKTPEEFTFKGKSTGFSFNPEFLNRMGYDRLSDLSVLIPRSNPEAWSKIGLSGGKALTDGISNDGKNPSQPKNLKLSGNKLSWSASSSKDVVGYRIYRVNDSDALTKVGHSTNTSFTVPNGNAAYTVKAVDYHGNESSIAKKVNASGEDKDAKKDKNDASDKDIKENEIKDKESDKEESKDRDKQEEKDKEKEKDKKDKEKEKDKKDKEKDKEKEKNKNDKEEKKTNKKP